MTRVGGTRAIPVDARVVAATNRDLEHEMEEGRFRKDLFFRLNVHTLVVPPLRERLSDVPLLTEHLLGTLCRRLGVRTRRLDPEALERLQSYDWRRNNVRELRNIIERLILVGDGPVITSADLPRDLGASGTRWGGLAEGPRPLKELKAEAERSILLTALERNQWHISKTAEELGLADHASLLKIMRRHDLKRP